ncbi:aliphatic sulfonate ABC transporter substrate-binding protein [Roseomonas sp. BN140053]|uniref:aliphatic sulfonate ABC transporter substrate-binding protein n=1 Tax=Roseomonas sp. BN140053 TaxID=3391898 RepID=UPI0039EC90C1
MRLSRRHATLSLAALACPALLPTSFSARAEDAPRELRIGYQKIGLLVVARQQRLIERRLAARNIPVRWVEFTAGPPLLEAMAVGSIDFGYAGDAPPIFAQAAGASIAYVAATPPSGDGEGILVKEASPIRTLADLRGRKVAFTRGSSAHNMTVAALEKSGLGYADISPVFLSPADAAAAFARDSIDAWTIWDPFFALAQARNRVRVLATGTQIKNSNSFLLANRGFADRFPETLGEVLVALEEAARWASDNRGQVAASLAEVTGVELAAQTVAAERGSFGVLPLSEAVLATQQDSADRFQRLGLIPCAVTVRDAVWSAARR